MISPNRLLDEQVRQISEMPDEVLQDFLLGLERAYIHAMIEAALRNQNGVSEPIRVSASA